LDILNGGLGIGKLQFLIKNFCYFFSAVIFFQFLGFKALDPDWIRIGVHHKMLDPDPDEMNADPQPCFFGDHFLACLDPDSAGARVFWHSEFSSNYCYFHQNIFEN
jgi:hypothetical protein